jgi:cell division protein FtsX
MHIALGLVCRCTCTVPVIVIVCLFSVNDMRQCQEDDVNLFVYLVPDVYTNFQKAAIGKPPFVRTKIIVISKHLFFSCYS